MTTTKTTLAQKIRQRLINYSLMIGSIIFTLWLVNFILGWLDPTGIWGSLHDQWELQGVILEHPTGYAYEPGSHDLVVYDVTVLDNHTRLVPDTNPSATCTIAIIGDSVSFGMGVDDEETFANLIARNYPVQIINTARPGYNAQQALWLADFYPADGYIYLHINNDDMPIIPYTRRENDFMPPFATLIVYARPLLDKFNEPSKDEQIQPPVQEDEANDWLASGQQVYSEAIEELVIRDDILIFASNYGLGQMLIEQHPQVLPIPHHKFRVSPTDPHPNAEGHEFLYEHMQPYLDNFFDDVCPD